MKNILIILFSCFFYSALAQRDADKSIEFESTVQNILLDENTGILYVKEDLRISAYSDETGETVWSTKISPASGGILAKSENNDLTSIGVDKDLFRFAPDSKYILMNISGKDLIIDRINGEIVFDSQEQFSGKIIEDKLFLPLENSFIIVNNDLDGLKASQMQISLFDLNTKTTRWTTPMERVSLLKQSMSFSSNRVESFNENLYVLLGSNLISLDKNKGTVKWSQNEIQDFMVCQNNENILVSKRKGNLSTKKIVNIINVTKGNYIWKEDLITRYIVSLQDWGDRVLIAHWKGFNMYNLKTGAKAYKKDVKAKNIKDVLTLGSDFLLVAGKDMILIDQNGEEKWKKSIEISDNEEDEVKLLELTKNNKIIYLTSTYGNMVDYNSGKKIWKKNIKFNEKRPLLFSYDEAKDNYLIYNDEELYKFDPKVIDKPEPFAKVKAKSDKTMAGLELFDWGVSLTSQSEVIGVDNKGGLVYQKQYKQPGEAGRIALKAAGKIGENYFRDKSGNQASTADMHDQVTYVDENGHQHTSKNYLLSEETRNRLNEKSKTNADIANTILDLTANVNKRFNALQQNSEYAYIFAKDESSDDENIKVLVKVRKKDGEEVDKVIVEGTKPLYTIDPVSNSLFFARKNRIDIFNKK